MLQCLGINEIYQISNSQAQSAHETPHKFTQFIGVPIFDAFIMSVITHLKVVNN